MRPSLGLGLLIAMAAPAPAQDNPPVTRQATCRWAETPPTLDGQLDDACWKAAEPITRFSAYWDRRPVTSTQTRAYLAWDDSAFYFAAEMTDKELRAFGSKRNDHLWEGDVFEVFLKPREDRPAYYEYEFNPRGALLELAIPKQPFDFDKAAAEPPTGIRVAVKVDGTLDRPGDTDRGWSVEGTIPWSAMTPTGGRPRPGDTWRFALCRYDYGPEGTKPVLMSSAPLTQPSFHRYEDYGKLTFAGEKD